MPVQWQCNFGRLVVCLAALSLAVASSFAHAEDTDIVYLKNGNFITGEILALRQGEFSVKTKAMGTVKIKWAYVDSIVSTKLVQIEVSDGTRFLGTVSPAASNKAIVVSSPDGTDVLNLDDIVLVQPVKRDISLWSAMDKYLQFGFSFTKATDIARWNFAAGLSHKEETYQLSVDANSMATEYRV